MGKASVVLASSAVMVLVTLALTLVIPKFAATIAGSVVASAVLTRVMLGRRAQHSELFAAGVLLSVLGSLLLGVAYHVILGYIGGARGIWEALETLLMMTRSGVLLYMFVVDLVLSFTSIMAVISLVSVIYVGD